MFALLAVLVVQGPEAARYDSLLAAGRTWLAHPVIGRYQALEAFRAAARLAPDDPAPLYGQVEVGFSLGSDEGEGIARQALLRIFAIDPDYRDSWTRFRQLFLSDRIARRADAALARHQAHAKALERRAELAIELREPARADSLAQRLQAPVMRFVLRADAAFLERRDSAGQAWHDSAVAYAALDSSGALWDRAWTIANAAETERYAGIRSGERPEFFRRFWSQRDPDLITSLNERLGEHTRRLAEARHQFRLLHPFRMQYRSQAARDLAWFDQRRWLDVQPLQDTAHLRAYRAGLDARGLTYVRHGPPDLRVPCAIDARYGRDLPGCTGILDAEGWLYRTPGGVLSVGFVSAEYFSPVSEDQLQHTEILLQTDATALPAPVVVRGWTAFFKGPGYFATDAYARAVGDTVALALWFADGELHGRVAGAGLLALTVRPGSYMAGLDVDSAGIRGRWRGELAVPLLEPDALRLSSLIVTPDSNSADRVSLLEAMPPDLAFASGAPLGAYTEIYGLSVVDGVARYRARYTFEPERSFFGRLVRGRSPVSFEFERRAEGSETVVERLVLEPGRVPPGRYRVTLAVTDELTNVKSETVTLVVTLR
jgi:hypothetical protein